MSSESDNGPSSGYDKDVEKGDTSTEKRRSYSDPSDFSNLDEYTALQKYITAYRDPRAAVVDDEEDTRKDAADAKKGKSWWMFWRRGQSKHAKTSDPGVVPEDWLNTDISKGVSESEVEGRRKLFGWNELTTEKENMFLKFLLYFTGPILYGKIRPF
jgi:H+-transporting ATPase